MCPYRKCCRAAASDGAADVPGAARRSRMPRVTPAAAAIAEIPAARRAASTRRPQRPAYTDDTEPRPTTHAYM